MNTTHHAALVTGASSGLGRAIARHLADQGLQVLATGRDAARLAETADRAGIATFPVDLTEDAGIDALAAYIGEHFGRLDVLVHCAALYGRGTISTSPVEALDILYRANLRAPYELTRRLLPLLCAAAGDVVFINSTLASGGSPNVAETSQYGATKMGLKALADSLRSEVNGQGVRVATVYVGRMATPMQEKLHATLAAPYRPERLLQPEDVAALIGNLLAAPRTLEVTDITIRQALK